MFNKRSWRNTVRLAMRGGAFVMTALGNSTCHGHSCEFFFGHGRGFSKRLRSLVIAACDRGVYVGIMLFAPLGAKKEDWLHLKVQEKE